MSSSESLLNIINYRGSYTQATASPLSTLLCDIPVLERSQISKYSEECSKSDDFETYFSNFPIKFSKYSDFKSTLEGYTPKKATKEIFIVLSQYAAIAWYQNYSEVEKDESGLCSILKILKTSMEISSIEPISNCFLVVCNKYYNNVTQNLSSQFVNLTFEMIGANIFSNSSFYTNLIFILKKVISSEKADLVESALTLIDSLITNNAPVLDVEDKNTIVIILQQHIAKLNMKAFGIVCKITPYLAKEFLKDTFILVASSLFSVVVVKTEKNSNILSTDEDEDEEDGELLDVIPKPPFEELSKIDFLDEDIKSIGVKMSECLCYATDESKRCLLTSMVNIIESVKVSNYIFTFFSLFFIIMRKIGTENLLSSLLSRITSNVLFSPSFCIYSKNGLNPIISTIRQQFFECMKNIDESLFSFVIDNRQPKLCAEYLLRGIYAGFDPKSFTNKEVLACISSSVICNRRYGLKKSAIDAQYGFFNFFAWLLNNEETLIFCLSSPTFASAFISTIYEPKLARFAIRLVRDALFKYKGQEKIDGTSTIFLEASEVLSNSKEKNNFELAMYLSECLDEAICPEISHQFGFCLNRLLKYVINFPNVDILHHVLKFMRNITINSPNYIKNCDLNNLVIAAIKVTEKEPSLKTLDILVSVISGNTSNMPIFLVRDPWVVPLILAVFGESKYIEKIFLLLFNLCKNSFENCKMMHQGGLDWILMKYVDQGRSTDEIVYNGIKIKLNISQKVWNELCQKILMSIFRSQCSNSIAFLVASHLRKAGAFSSALINEMSYEVFLPHKKYQLGFNSPSVKIESVPQEIISDSFSFSFRLNLDLVAFSMIAKPVNLITFKCNNIVINICIFNNSLYATYREESKPVVSVLLIKNIVKAGWKYYAVGVDVAASPILFTPCSEKTWHNESELVGVELTESTVITVADGGPDMFCGFITDIRFYKDIISKENPTFGEEFASTDCLKANGVHQEVLNNGTRIVNRTSRSSPKLLIDALYRGNNLNEIAKYFEDPKDLESTIQILEVLKIIFEFNQLAQKTFKSCKIIRSSLLTHKELINYKTYIACWRIFLVLTNEKLKNEWFESVIFNPWILANSKPIDFIRILNHWSSVVLSEALPIIRTKDYFSTFSSIMRLFFCFDSEESHKIKKSELPVEGMSAEEKEKCSNAFALFIKRLAYVHLTMDGVNVLFDHMFTCKSKKNTLQLLDLMLDISERIIKLKDFSMSFINKINYFLSSKDLDIIEKAIYVICKISGNQIIMVLNGIPLQIKDKETQEQIYSRIITKIDKYPNLFPLLIIIALNLGKDLNELANIVNKWVESGIEFNAPPYWFIWPLIAALNDKERCSSFCKFIAKVLITSPRRNEEIYDIILLLRFIGKETSLESDNALRDLINDIVELAEDADQKFKGIIGYLCFTYSIFALYAPILSNRAIKEFSMSPYRAYNLYNATPSVFQSELTTVSHLEHLMYFNIASIPIRFFYDVDENGEWINKEVAEFGVRFLDDSEEKKYLQQLLNEEKLSEEDQFNLKKNSFAFFESENDKYVTLFRTKFFNFANIFRDLADKTRQMIAEMQCFNSFATDSVEKLENEFEKFQSMQKVKEFVPMRVRDRTLCIQYCSLKTKLTKNNKKKPLIKIVGEVIYEQPAKLISLKGERSIKVSVTNDSIYFTGRYFIKAFYIQMINLVLTRKMKDETAIEFFLSDGRNYLVDLAPTKNMMFVNLIKKFFTEKQFIQTMPAPELFEAFPLMIDWERGVLTNFEYLMKLNILSGRSFNDPNLYPIFPSVLGKFATFASKDIKNIQYNAPDTERVGKVPKITKKLSESICINGCIAPEFFFLPSVISDESELPSWAKDKFDFIYKHLKLLESKEVRDALPSFIDNIWGPKMKTTTHRKLFVKKHPSSSLVKVLKATKMSKKIDIASDIQYIVKLKVSNPMVYSFLLFTIDGNVFNYCFSIVGNFSERPIKEMFTLPNDDDPVFSDSPKGAIRLSTKNNNVHIISNMKERVRSIYTEVPLISYCNKSFLFCPDQCSVGYCIDYHKHISPLILMHSNSQISMLESYANFKVFAIVCIDGTVEVHSLKDGSFVGSSVIQGQPRHLLFTKSFGHLVCVSSTEVLVMSVDGIEISRTKISHPFEKIFQYQSIEGFDFIIAIDSEERCIIFDVMNPSEMKTVFSGAKDVIYATYNVIKQCIITINSKGIVSLIPFVFK